MTTMRSEPEAGPRPFYGEFAWAYDDLVERPVADECAGMAAALARRGIGPGAALLDAGCGTGRYAMELARRGFAVTGIDRSPAMLAEARPRGRLVFRSVTRLDPATRSLLVSERHTLTTAAGEMAASHEFAMRCWSRDELDDALGAAGFDGVAYAGTYAGAPLGTGDRIVVGASLGAR
jgi:SAM-dependent methyltransferase